MTNPGTQSSIAGTAATLAIAATDADGDTLSYSATGLPTGLGINAGTGVISGTIASGASGTFNATVTVSDGRLSTPVAFSWTVAVPGAFAVDRVVSADSATGTVTTPAFSTSFPGETLVAFVTASQATTSVTGAGLTWTLVRRANAQTGSPTSPCELC